MIDRPEMLSLLHAVAVAAAGAGLGIASAARLRTTVERLVASRRPARRLAADFAVRTAITLAPIPLLAAGRPVAVVAGLLAFMVARRLAIHRLARRMPARPVAPASAAEHPA